MPKSLTSSTSGACAPALATRSTPSASSGCAPPQSSGPEGPLARRRNADHDAAQQNARRRAHNDLPMARTGPHTGPHLQRARRVALLASRSNPPAPKWPETSALLVASVRHGDDRVWRAWLERRSQRASMARGRFHQSLERYPLPSPRLVWSIAAAQRVRDPKSRMQQFCRLRAVDVLQGSVRLALPKPTLARNGARQRSIPTPPDALRTQATGKLHQPPATSTGCSSWSTWSRSYRPSSSSTGAGCCSTRAATNTCPRMIPCIGRSRRNRCWCSTRHTCALCRGYNNGLIDSPSCTCKCRRRHPPLPTLAGRRSLARIPQWTPGRRHPCRQLGMRRRRAVRLMSTADGQLRRFARRLPNRHTARQGSRCRGLRRRSSQPGLGARARGDRGRRPKLACPIRAGSNGVDRALCQLDHSAGRSRPSVLGPETACLSARLARRSIEGDHGVMRTVGPVAIAAFAAALALSSRAARSSTRAADPPRAPA
jgi:hypothetical protein